LTTVIMMTLPLPVEVMVEEQMMQVAVVQPIGFQGTLKKKFPNEFVCLATSDNVKSGVFFQKIAQMGLLLPYGTEKIQGFELSVVSSLMLTSKMVK